MQSVVGNQAVGRMLQRQPAPGGGGGGGQRTILIDANVIGEINRGNAQAARKLLELRSSHKVYISQQAFNELTSQPGSMIAGVGPDLPRIATANRLLLQELGIEVAPSGAMSDRIGAHADNIQNMRGNISAEDMAHIAQAKAIGAEVWSLDKTFRKHASMIKTQLGVTVAPESTTIPMVGGKAVEDYRVARKLLKLEEVEISVKGVVKPKTPKPPSGGGGLGPSRPFRPPAGGGAGNAADIAREAARNAATNSKLFKATRLLEKAGGVLEMASAVDTLVKFMGMAHGGLSGDGFVLKKEIKWAEKLEIEARALRDSYQNYSEHREFGRLWDAARDGRAAGQAAYHVDELLIELTTLRRNLAERTGPLVRLQQDIDLKVEAAENILGSGPARTAISTFTFGTADVAELVPVSRDMVRIRGHLGGAITAFHDMAERLDADIEVLNGFEAFLFRTCEEAGYCSTTYKRILGEPVRIRDYPALE